MLTPVPPSDCTRAREAASARLDGELSELEGAHLDAHLLGCAVCRRYLAEIGVVARSLRAAELEEPALPVFVARRRRPVVRVHLAAAALVIAAVTASSFALGQVVGSSGGGPTATVGRTVVSPQAERRALLEILRKRGPARMNSSHQVIPV